jgi:hypothetical protein
MFNYITAIFDLTQVVPPFQVRLGSVMLITSFISLTSIQNEDYSLMRCASMETAHLLDTEVFKITFLIFSIYTVTNWKVAGSSPG